MKNAKSCANNFTFYHFFQLLDEKRELKSLLFEFAQTFGQPNNDEEKNVTTIHRDITLLGDLAQEDRDRLLQIANKCPVHKVLTNPINIDTVLLT